MGVTVDVVIPMLGRPQRVESILDDLDRTSEDGFELIPVFVVSPDDRPVLQEVGRSESNYVVMAEPAERGDYARKTNAAFKFTEGEWVFLGASDLRFHPGWASAAVAIGEEMEVGVVGTDDMGNPQVQRGLHSTHSLVRRSYIDEWGGGWDGPGVVYHEGYFHQYVDTELVTAAQARGMWAFAHGSRVEHLHPYWHKSQMDETYRRALDHPEGRRDARLFKQRSRQYVHRPMSRRGLQRADPVRADGGGAQDAD